VLGEVYAIASPVWRMSLWRNIENFQSLNRMMLKKDERQRQSEVFTSEEIYMKYSLKRGDKHHPPNM
jgi:hypothetical protein